MKENKIKIAEKEKGVNIDVDNPKDIDYVLSQLEDINQPINAQLGTLLQVVCLKTTDEAIVEYLLKKGANPNYLDCKGWSAFQYAAYNEASLPFFPLLIIQKLIRYSNNFPKEDPEARRTGVLDWVLKKKKEVQS